jgi:hypothetical protein
MHLLILLKDPNQNYELKKSKVTSMLLLVLLVLFTCYYKPVHCI